MLNLSTPKVKEIVSTKLKIETFRFNDSRKSIMVNYDELNDENQIIERHIVMIEEAEIANLDTEATELVTGEEGLSVFDAIKKVLYLKILADNELEGTIE